MTEQEKALAKFGEMVYNEAKQAMYWYKSSVRVAKPPEFSIGKAQSLLRFAKRFGVEDDNT